MNYKIMYVNSMLIMLLYYVDFMIITNWLLDNTKKKSFISSGTWNKI